MTLLEAVENKKKILVKIDEQILIEVDSEGITQEVLETDENYLDLDSKVRKFKKLVKPTTPSSFSLLRTSAPDIFPQSNPFDGSLNQEAHCQVKTTAYPSYRFLNLMETF